MHKYLHSIGTLCIQEVTREDPINNHSETIETKQKVLKKNVEQTIKENKWLRDVQIVQVRKIILFIQ